MICITGTSGFLGKHILENLASLDIPILSLSRTKIITKHANIRWKYFNLEDDSYDENLLEGCTHLIHMAGAIKGRSEKIRKVNFYGTKKIVHLAETHKVEKVIFVSSIDAILFENPYSKSKVDSERELRKSKLSWVIVRPSVMFGKGDTKNFFILNKIVRTLPIIPMPFNGNFLWQPVCVDDVAIFIANLLKDNSVVNDAINLIGPNDLTFCEIISIIEKMNNTRRIKFPVSPAITTFLIKLLSLLIGVQRTNDIFSSFSTKIVSSSETHTIRLSTKLNNILLD
jgi:nucleoside-diphosphate-sugar epimerase